MATTNAMAAAKVEQSCQTGGSLSSLPDASNSGSSHFSHGRYYEDGGRDEVEGHYVAALQRSVEAASDSLDDERDYDEVAGGTDNSSLHCQLEEIERCTKAPRDERKASELGFCDALPQVLAALIVNLLPLQAGINMAYSAILIPQLSDPLADIHISTDEASWIASLVTISLPLGSLAIGPLIDRYGRRRVAVLATLPFLAGWLLVAGARNVYMLYAARLMCGAAGGLSTVSIIYVSEIADPRLRPALLCLNSVYVSLGILVTCVLGMFFEWRLIAAIYAASTVVSMLLLLAVPESPQWVRTFRPAEVQRMQRALRWIYRRQALYELNLERLQRTQATQSNGGQQQKQLLLTAKQQEAVATGAKVVEARQAPWFEVYCQPHVYKPLAILLAMFVFQQLSGAYVIIFYAVNLFLKIGGHFGDGINEYGALLLLGTIRFVMSIVAALLSQKVGRRKLMFISGLGMALCTLAAGLYMHYEQLMVEYYARTENPADDIDPEHRGNDLVLLCCVLGYVSFCALGFMVIPWILIGEILPTQVKGVLGGAVMAAAYVLMFGAVKAFPYAMDWLGAQGIFYVFATTSFVGVVYVFVYLPETLGRSFEQIERRFRRRGH